MSPTKFADVKALLDKAVAGWREAHGREPNLSQHSASFGWTTRAELLSAKAFGKRLIAPEFIGNGRGRETALVVALTTGVSPFPRMPSDGPFLTEDEIATIAAWIDLGAPDDGSGGTPGHAPEAV
jgi:hypothetical protein